jgi:hypothetical protein
LNSKTKQRKESIRSELEHARSDFHAMLDSLDEEGWYRQSRNPAWTNGQLLFHITLGFGLIPALLPIVKCFGKLPPVFSEKFAALLNWSTPFFNWINALAPRIGARIYKLDSLGRKFDKVHNTIIKRLYSIGDEEWKLGMHAPVKWDPARFEEFMQLEAFFRYPVAHFRHHKTQFVVEQDKLFPEE